MPPVELTEKGRGTPPIGDRAKVFNRDGWHCRYCGRRVMVEIALELIWMIAPDLLVWNFNHKGGIAHPAVIYECVECDHRQPLADQAIFKSPKCRKVHDSSLVLCLRFQRRGRRAVPRGSEKPPPTWTR